MVGLFDIVTHPQPATGIGTNMGLQIQHNRFNIPYTCMYMFLLLALAVAGSNLCLPLCFFNFLELSTQIDNLCCD